MTLRPADDPKFDFKGLVQRGYNLCAPNYHEARRSEPGHEVDLLVDVLETGAHVLDIGCGSGVPVGRFLSQQFTVTGVDISAKMVRLAQLNMPGAELICGDIMSVEFPSGRFDGVVAMYLIFHIPREEHRELFSRIHDWLKPNGYVLCTLALYDDPPYLEDDFFGATMYWSNFGLDEYLSILDDIGFDLIRTFIAGHGYSEEAVAPDEYHPLILARKR